MDSPQSTADSAKVPLHKKLLWGAGGASDNLLYNGLATLVLPIFNVGLGVNAVALGFAMGLPRLLDAVTDPVVGNLSDNTRTRWGRRRPYIFCGAILSGLLLAVLFNPVRGWSEDALFWWFLIVCSLFYLVYTLFMIPYSALGYELTSDYNERTRVLAWRPYLGLTAGLAIPWLYKLCFVFGETEAEGARVVAIVMGCVAAGLGILPAIFLREKTHLPAEKKIPLLQALKVTFSNRAFLLLTASTLCILLGIFLAAPLGLYVSIFYVFGGDKEGAALLGGWAGMAGMLSGFGGLPIATWLSSRVGKRHAALGLLGVALLSTPLTWWMFTPANPWLQIIPGFLFGLAANGCFLMGVSMLGDVCDADELETGLRREGLYSASLEFGKKSAIALSTILSGFVLAIAGFNEKLNEQTDDTLVALRVGYIVVLGGTVFLAAVFLYFYPLTRERSLEVRRLLDLRHANTSRSGGGSADE